VVWCVRGFVLWWYAYLVDLSCALCVRGSGQVVSVTNLEICL